MASTSCKDVIAFGYKMLHEEYELASIVLQGMTWETGEPVVQQHACERWGVEDSLGSNHDGEGGGQLSGEPTGGRQLGQLHSHGASDIVAVGSEADDQAERTNEDDPDRRLHILLEGSGLVDLPDGGQGTCHVADLTGAVREDDADGGEDLVTSAQMMTSA